METILTVHICLTVKCGFSAAHTISMKVAAKLRKHQVWYILTDERDQTQHLTIAFRAVGNWSTLLFPTDKECMVFSTLVLVCTVWLMALWQDTRSLKWLGGYDILTLRLLMSYIYGAHILDVSRPHTTTQHSR